MTPSMISIKRLLERNAPPSANESHPEGVSRLHGLLVETLEEHHKAEWGITSEFALAVRELLDRLETDPTPSELLDLACEALAIFEQHSRQTSDFFHEESRQMQSIVVMLTDTIAEISAQSDTSISGLQSIERQIQQVSSLDDIRCLKASLASCLTEVKEGIVQQRDAMQATLKQLHDQIRMPRSSDPRPETPGFGGALAVTEKSEADYVIVFKLQRSDHIRSRFGDVAIEQMLAVLEAGLKPARQLSDQLMHWKRDSFLIFARSSEPIAVLSQRFSRIVSGIGQRHIELGKNSALLAIGVDWIILAQAQYSSLERLFLDVDLFLSEKPRGGS